MVQEAENYRDEDEANESKYEAENGLEIYHFTCETHRLKETLGEVRKR